jgi:hypothetical protein
MAWEEAQMITLAVVIFMSASFALGILCGQRFAFDKSSRHLATILFEIHQGLEEEDRPKFLKALNNSVNSRIKMMVLK